MPYTFNTSYQPPHINEIFGFAIDLNKVVAISRPSFSLRYTKPLIKVSITVTGSDKAIEYIHNVPFIDRDGSVLVTDRLFRTTYPKIWTKIDLDSEFVVEQVVVEDLVTRFIQDWRGV